MTDAAYFTCKKLINLQLLLKQLFFRVPTETSLANVFIANRAAFGF